MVGGGPRAVAIKGFGMSADGAEYARTNSVGDSKITEDIWRWAKRQAIGQMDLSFGAKECWRILDGFPSGSCYPSHYYIAETMRKSVSAVRRYLRELKEGGYIEITARLDGIRQGPRGKSRPLGQTSNDYTILDQPDLIARARQLLQEWRAKQQRSNG